MDASQIFQTEDHSLQSFVERVFSEDPPSDPNTYTLTLDTDFTNTSEDFKTVFEALATVFTLGMRFKYADSQTGQVNLAAISEQQFDRIKAHFRSFGYNVDYEATPFTQFEPSTTEDDDLPSLADISTEASPVETEQTSHNLDDLPTTQGDKLEDYFITLKTEHAKYKVWFTYGA